MALATRLTARVVYSTLTIFTGIMTMPDNGSVRMLVVV